LSLVWYFVRRKGAGGVDKFVYEWQKGALENQEAASSLSGKPVTD
jgi:hypothetical protein